MVVVCSNSISGIQVPTTVPIFKKITSFRLTTYKTCITNFSYSFQFFFCFLFLHFAQQFYKRNCTAQSFSFAGLLCLFELFCYLTIFWIIFLSFYLHLIGVPVFLFIPFEFMKNKTYYIPVSSWIKYLFIKEPAFFALFGCLYIVLFLSDLN